MVKINVLTESPDLSIIRGRNLEGVTAIHLDHDHIGEHAHEHTHDGVAHTHEHTHEHAHDHQLTPMEELLALMNYMVGHNASHVREMADLAKQLDDIGEHDAYEQVLSAVAEFEKGNDKLRDVLAGLKKD